MKGGNGGKIRKTRREGVTEIEAEGRKMKGKKNIENIY
jgi:hypothetical protein